VPYGRSDCHLRVAEAFGLGVRYGFPGGGDALYCVEGFVPVDNFIYTLSHTCWLPKPSDEEAASPEMLDYFLSLGFKPLIFWLGRDSVVLVYNEIKGGWTDADLPKGLYVREGGEALRVVAGKKIKCQVDFSMPDEVGTCIYLRQLEVYRASRRASEERRLRELLQGVHIWASGSV